MSELYQTLCDPKTVTLAGFLWGMSQHVKIDAKTANNPLSKLLDGACEGGCYALGAAFVSWCMPKEIRGVVTTMCIVAIGAQKINEIYTLGKNSVLESNDSQKSKK